MWPRRSWISSRNCPSPLSWPRGASNKSGVWRRGAWASGILGLGLRGLALGELAFSGLVRAWAPVEPWDWFATILKPSDNETTIA